MAGVTWDLYRGMPNLHSMRLAPPLHQPRLPCQRPLRPRDRRPRHAGAFFPAPNCSWSQAEPSPRSNEGATAGFSSQRMIKIRFCAALSGGARPDNSRVVQAWDLPVSFPKSLLHPSIQLISFLSLVCQTSSAEDSPDGRSHAAAPVPGRGEENLTPEASNQCEDHSSCAVVMVDMACPIGAGDC